MDRRGFLRTAAYYTVAAAGAGLAACAPISDEPQGSFQFTHGVASGDPKSTSVVFWTRCLRLPASSDRVELALQVSTSPAFESTAAGALASAVATHDFTVRVKITGLLPDTRYWYRFIAGSDMSPAGQTRTAPDADSTRTEVRFAWMSCQDWGSNHWGAMELLAAEDLDFVVHLGDYIYEAVGGGAPAGLLEQRHGPIRLPDGRPLHGGAAYYAASLEDYRTLYRTYRSDTRLQNLHARFPMISIWDDHEFSDDCFGAHTAYRNDNEPDVPRRRAANQAWAEYMPVDFGDLSFDPASASHENIRIYRDLHFGPLLHLVATDSRLFRDDHAVSERAQAIRDGADPVLGANALGSRYFVPITTLNEAEAEVIARTGSPPSILGRVQSQWWQQTMAASASAWRVWANTTTMNRLWLNFPLTGSQPGSTADPQTLAINCDCWDGYPADRRALLDALLRMDKKNTVAISGDIHAFQCGVVRSDPAVLSSSPALVDFVVAGVSSGSYYSYLRAGATGRLAAMAPMVASPQAFDAAMRAANPDLLYTDHDAQGYATMTVQADRLTVTYTKVNPLTADGKHPDNPISRRTRIVLMRDSLQPQVLESV